ncbi:MAG: hypothetical protein U9Q83_05655 [Bacteroidota bacterium]|nr:hypothetical protein [Bacteroidota bacterium]
MKKQLYIFFIVLISGCSQCNLTNQIIIENGKLPDSALLYIPYQDGEIYKFKHSNGLVVNFSTYRKTTDEITGCVEYCKYETHYQKNSTNLYPDYPIFDINLEINNLDTNYIFCSAFIAKSSFIIPTGNNNFENVKKMDSVLIDTVYYKDVFKIKANYYSYIDESISVDSMYYNYEFGILKIIITNDETYTIYK